jgi:hypothetical protein
MPSVKTNDGVEIFYKDWGSGQRSSLAPAGRRLPTIEMPSLKAVRSELDVAPQ